MFSDFKSALFLVAFSFFINSCYLASPKDRVTRSELAKEDGVGLDLLYNLKDRISDNRDGLSYEIIPPPMDSAKRFKMRKQLGNDEAEILLEGKWTKVSRNTARGIMKSRLVELSDYEIKGWLLVEISGDNMSQEIVAVAMDYGPLFFFNDQCE